MSSGTLKRSHGYLEGVGRLRLHYRTWEVSAPRAAIIVVHGLQEHAGRYEDFAEAMAGYQFSTFVVDLRGHGASEGRRGHVPRFDVFLQDIDRFRREVQGLVALECPLFMLGHSMGGLITLRYVEEYDAPLRGAIISAPWLGTSMDVPRWKLNLANALNHVLPAFPFRNPVDALLLSHDPEVVQRYQTDPYVHDRITPRTFCEASTAIGLVLQRSDRINIPLFFLLAGQDRVVDTRKSLAFARSLADLDVTIRTVPDAFHEVLNEVNRGVTHAEVRDWIMEHLR